MSTGVALNEGENPCRHTPALSLACNRLNVESTGNAQARQTIQRARANATRQVPHQPLSPNLGRGRSG
jgi:hypothetical protein